MTTQSLTPDPVAATPAPAGAVSAGRGRASWSGLLRLSLVAVPVRAFPAVASAPDSRCHQLHAGCGERGYLGIGQGAIVSAHFVHQPQEVAPVQSVSANVHRRIRGKQVCAAGADTFAGDKTTRSNRAPN